MAEPKHPIPSEFHSFETGAPFTHCIECAHRLDDDRPYIVEKAIRQYPDYKVKDVLFDYAICLPCADTMKERMSKESMERITEYFNERVDIFKQLAIYSSEPGNSYSRCLVSGKPTEECYEYQIYALCQGDQLYEGMPPYMISGEVMEEIIPLLSEKTKDELDGFFRKHFSPDPTLMEPIGPKLILI
jgi:hypothetical protein